MTYDALLLRTAATDLLASAVACYSEVDNAPDLPAETYVAHGVVAIDDTCEALIVHAQRIRWEPQSAEQRCVVIPIVRFGVTVIRCNTALQADGVLLSGYQEISLDLLDDLSTLMIGLRRQAQDGDLFPSFPGIECDQVQLIDGEPAEPGNLLRWRMSVEVRITSPYTPGS